MSFIDNMLNGKTEKEASLIPQGENKEAHENLKIENSNWVKEAMELDPVAVEAEYQANLAAEAKMLGKTAAYEMGETPKETIEKDYARDVKILSDYALAELLAEARGKKAQNTAEMYWELKEKAKAEVASSREKAEKALLEMIPDHTMLDWQKAFEKFTKEAKPEEPKEKDLYKSEVPEKAHDFDSPSENKFKVPADQEKAIPGNGREADERKEVTQEAGVLKEDIVKEASVKVADKVKDSPADDKGNLAMPEGKKSVGDKPVESVEEPTAGVGKKEVGDKDDQAAEANSPEKGDKAKHDEAVNKKASECKNPKHGKPCDSKCPACIDECSEYNKPSKKAHCGSCPGDPGHEQAVSPLKREELPTEVKADVEGCPVCGGSGEDLGNLGSREHMRCRDCGITYSHKEGSCGHCGAMEEIKSCASKADVIKKIAEIESPWKIIKDESGQDVIARVTPDLKKESEEDKPEELKK